MFECCGRQLGHNRHNWNNRPTILLNPLPFEVCSLPATVRIDPRRKLQTGYPYYPCRENECQTDHIWGCPRGRYSVRDVSSEKSSRRIEMKKAICFAAALMLCCVSFADVEAGLFKGRLLKKCRIVKDCCVDDCCVPTCCAPECCEEECCPSCCAPSSCCPNECCDNGECAPTCCAPKCCAPRRRCCLPKCCAPKCCAPKCCDDHCTPSCCAPSCCAPSCCVPCHN